jgi:hypothetical protein
MGNSFDRAILEEPDRFITGIKAGNPSNLAEFEQALYDYLQAPKGEISKDTIIALFEMKETKEAIKKNVSDEEYEKLYGDGIKVTRQVVGKKIITISTPKISVQRHRWRNKYVPAYNRSYVKWQTSEIKFLKVRKVRKIPASKIVQEYNKHFKINPRTSSSISTKLYRL